jgi:hypothetical protein
MFQTGTTEPEFSILSAQVVASQVKNIPWKRKEAANA